MIARDLRARALARASNTGILGSQAELITFCDDDDEWLPGKLTAQVKLLTAHPEATVASYGIYMRFQDNDRLRLPPADPLGYHDFLRSRIMEIHPARSPDWPVTSGEESRVGRGRVDQRLGDAVGRNPFESSITSLIKAATEFPDFEAEIDQNWPGSDSPTTGRRSPGSGDHTSSTLSGVMNAATASTSSTISDAQQVITGAGDLPALNGPVESGFTAASTKASLRGQYDAVDRVGRSCIVRFKGN